MIFIRFPKIFFEFPSRPRRGISRASDSTILADLVQFLNPPSNWSNDEGRWKKNECIGVRSRPDVDARVACIRNSRYGNKSSRKTRELLVTNYGVAPGRDAEILRIIAGSGSCYAKFSSFVFWLITVTCVPSRESSKRNIIWRRGFEDECEK